MAETKVAAELAFDAFIESFSEIREAAGCLSKDRDTLPAFYDFPAEHWKHLRTTNPIESTFAQCATAPSDRGLFVEWDRARHGLQTGRGREKAGAVSMATTSCQNSFLV